MVAIIIEGRLKLERKKTQIDQLHNLHEKCMNE